MIHGYNIESYWLKFVFGLGNNWNDF